MEKGLIFDIQGFSVHDGPGCRTLVFLSGCPLRCSWCSNPEGQLLRPRLMYSANRCVHKYYRCINACPHYAIQITDSTPYLKFERSLCDHCDAMACVRACLNEALGIAGRYYTADELMKILLRDQRFWGSEGGVTFTGGEPLAQTKFLLTVLEKCRSHYIHTAIETCAYIDTDLLMEVLTMTDWLFIDLKHIDPAMHRAETGVDNELILKNIETVASCGWNGRLVIRVPLIPGFNDDAGNLQATAEFMVRLKLREINIIPFHRLGNSKYEQLGLKYEFAQQTPPSKENLENARQIFENASLQCYIDFETPF